MIVSKETLEFPLNSESLRKMEDIELIIEREFSKYKDTKLNKTISISEKDIEKLKSIKNNNYGGCIAPRFFMEIIVSVVGQICESENAK